ncbi:MAG: hypothetical protein JO237_00410 [Pseudolabrys sp.]|nr:hypothetical protein [Pseudolabrys sp.]
MNPADSRAYDIAIECAALCMIALWSQQSDEFREHLRDSLRDALYLCGVFGEDAQSIDKFEARNVLTDVVTRSMMIFSDELAPLLTVNDSSETATNAELALSECLRAVLARIDEMCLSEQ